MTGASPAQKGAPAKTDATPDQEVREPESPSSENSFPSTEKPKSADAESIEPQPRSAETAPKDSPDTSKSDTEAGQPNSKSSASPTAPKDSPTPSSRRKKARRTTPNLSSLADLEASIESQQTSKENAGSDFTEPEVQAFFKKLANTTNPGALKLVLDHVRVQIQNGELFLFVESPVEKTTLLQEVDLIQSLRDRFGRGKLKVHIEIDPEREVDTQAPERPKTKKEVLDDFARQNETFHEMMDRWKLTFDK